MVSGTRTLALILLVVLLSGPAAYAQPAQSASVPPFFSYRGTITANGGKPLAGIVGVTFALYENQQGGSPLWLDSQNVQLDATGTYSVVLGAVGKSLPLDLFSSGQPRWLGVQPQIEGEAEQARVLLVSVPYALKAGDADTIGGKPASAFVLAEPTTAYSSKFSAENSGGGGGPVISAISGTGSANTITKWLDTIGTVVDSNMSEVGGNVGIATATPGAKLSVNSLPGPLDYNTAGAIIGASAPLAGGGADGNLPGTTLQLRQSSFIGSALGLFGGDAFDAPVNATSFSFNSLKNNDGSNGGQYGIVANIAGIKENPIANNLAGALAFSTHANHAFRDAIERMRIDSNGNVGIGTTTPGAKLTVNALPGPLEYNAAGAVIGSASALAGGGADGNLPGTTLQLKQSSSIGSALGLFGGDAFDAPFNSTSFSFNSLKNNDGSNGGHYGIVANIAGIKENPIANNLAGALAFSTHGNHAFRDAVERMRIDSNGYVGIGTSTPTQRLDVNGVIKGTAILGDGSALTGVSASTVTCAAACISTAEVVDAAITAPKLADASIATAKLADASVTAPKIADGSITAAKLALTDSARTRGITYLGGCETCSVLADTDDQPMIYYNVVGPMDFVSVVCFTDSSTTLPTINIQRVVGNGVPQNVLAAPLTCNGTATTSFSVGSLGKNDKLDFVMVTAGGVAKRVTVALETRVN
jgi:hypothetical protein